MYDDRSTWLLAIALLTMGAVGLWMSDHPAMVDAIYRWLSGG